MTEINTFGLTRRSLLAGSPALLAGLAAAPLSAAIATVRLRPGGLGVACALSAEGGDTRLALPGEGDPVALPGLPDGIQALPIAERQILACGTVLPDGQRLLAFVGWDDATVRILGVESRAWHGPDRRSLALRVAAVPDGARLRLIYDAVAGERHESWTDALAWRPEAPLASEPLRPVLPGTLQARVASIRADVALLLAPPRRVLALADLQPTGLLSPLG